MIYVGSIRHKDKIYDGEHEPIIDRQIFDDVLRLLQNQTPARKSSSNQQDGHLLTGILYDEAGEKLRAVHANKRGIRYRYYVSRKLVEGYKKDADGWRLPANEVDSVVENQLFQLLHDRARLSGWIQKLHPVANLAAALDRIALLITRLATDATQVRRDLVRTLLRCVTLAPGTITIDIDGSAIIAELMPERGQAKRPKHDAMISIECPISLKRRGVEMRMVLTNDVGPRRAPDASLVQLILRANRYLALLNDGQDRTLSDVAAAEGVDLSEVSRILPLAFLSPSIVDSIFAGSQSVSLTTQRLLRIGDLPASWRQQSELFARA